ncbi:MAG TPA: hypothetical protein VFW45_13720 [Candidatus Polarisedimenticolia bacterium]|nr:hypothetical protein [Candidatus Polarisedimenticolia bacterium]
MNRTWMPKLAAVAVVLVGLAVMSSAIPVPTAVPDSRIDPAQFPAASDCGLDTGQIPPGFFDQDGAAPEPMACRRLPECFSDSDCDVLCGGGGGKCVHSNCPTRICKCR